MTVKTFEAISGPQNVVKRIVNDSVDNSSPIQVILDCTAFPGADQHDQIEVGIIIANFGGTGNITVKQTGVEDAEASGFEEVIPVQETFSANTTWTALASIIQMRKWPYVVLDITAAAGISGDIQIYVVGKNF